MKDNTRTVTGSTHITQSIKWYLIFIKWLDFLPMFSLIIPGEAFSNPDLLMRACRYYPIWVCLGESKSLCRCRDDIKWLHGFLSSVLWTFKEEHKRLESLLFSPKLDAWIGQISIIKSVTNLIVFHTIKITEYHLRKYLR